MVREDWRDSSLCAQVDPDLFYGRNYRAAKAICGVCPALLDCGEAALKNEEEHGVWGAKTPNERLFQLRAIHGQDYEWPGDVMNHPTERTKCRAGHDQAENLVLTAGGWRCRLCQRKANRESNVRQRDRRRALREAA